MIVLNVGHHAWSTGELQVFVSPHCVNIDKTLLRHLTIYVTDIYTAIRVGLLNTSPQQHTRSITVSRIKLIRCRRNDNDACSSRNNRFNVRHQWHRRLTSQGDSGGAASVCVCVCVRVTRLHHGNRAVRRHQLRQLLECSLLLNLSPRCIGYNRPRTAT